MKYCTLCKAKYDDSVSFCPVDGEVLEDDPSSIVNTVLDGQYQMEAMLGKGGMGAVYRARHILLGDRVAIKVLPPEVRNNAEWLRRFRREGQAARRFRHPNSVTVYDLRTASDGTIYMVMEYVEGQTLDAEIRKRGKFTAAQAYELLAPIMSVLDTAHSMGVVHRDLKPENIMVGKPDTDGLPVVKLLDLGIAKMREIAGVDTQGNTALTTAGQVLGTPYYMSPEQWGEIPRDGNVEIDGRADIYSLGLVFYEMIAGRRCFAGTTLHELRREHVSRTAKPLHEVVPDVPRGFSEAIQRATAKDRADRQSTARQLAAELRAGLGKAAGNVQPGATDFVRPAAADTVGVGLDTKSDLNAPTLVAMNGAASRPPAIEHAQSDVSETLVDVAAQEPKGTSPTLAASPSMTGSSSVPHLGSGVTLEQEPTTGHVIPAKSSRKIGLMIGLGLAFVFLFVFAIAGIFLISRKHSDTSTANTSKNAGNINKTTEPETRPREIARYWLELEPRSAKESPTLVAGMVPIASGQSLKLHFVFNEPGFVYIFGPGGDNNQPTAFLTNKPFPDSGLKSNEAKRGVDFSFPDGGGRLTLDTRAGTDVFTIIFSRLPLSSPAFLDAQVTGKPLKEAERTELTQFLQKYRQTTPSTELDETDLKAPFVKVNFAPTRDVTAEDTNPFVFDIRIQHN